MGLKRYSITELIEICTDLFYNYMVEGDKFYDSSSLNQINWTPHTCTGQYSNPAIWLHKTYLSALEENKIKRNDLMRALHSYTIDKNYKQMIESQLEFHNKENEVLSNLNMKLQKRIYKDSQNLALSHSSIKFPLNKLINSLYDDLWVEVLFFDDVCTPHGQLAEFIATPREKQKEFIKQHTEITHIGLILNTRTPAVIVIKGSPETEKDPERTIGKVKVLESEFGDFENLRLADINRINNNDLKQILQSKIDLDKEGLKLLAEEQIRGDVYQLYHDNTQQEHWDFSGYYIRYICASTGRVYYNPLNLRNLAVSDYFNRKDYGSYLKAWWNITHLGARVEGNPVISC